MDNTDDLLLEQYLRGELSESEVVALQARLANEPQLASTLNELQNIQDGIRYHRLQEKLTEIQSWEIDIVNEAPNDSFEADVNQAIRFSKQKELLAEIKGFELAEAEVPTPTNSKQQLHRTWWTMAAGIAILLSAAWFLWDGERENAMTNEELFAEYFEPYPANMVKRGGEVDSLMMGYLAYESGDYVTAIEIFEVQTDTISQFFLGVSYLGIGEVHKAIETLKKYEVVAVVLKDQSLWYRALSHIKLDNKSEAIDLLEKIKSSNPSIQIKPRILIDKLQNQVFKK